MAGGLTIGNIQKLMDAHSRLVKAGAGSRVGSYTFRLDLVGLNPKWALRNLKNPLRVKEDRLLKTVVIEGEGSHNLILSLLTSVMSKLKDISCRVVKAQVRDPSDDYYICVLGDGRVISDTSY